MPITDKNKGNTMFLDFSNELINFKFQITDGSVNLIDISAKGVKVLPKTDERRCRIAELQITGGNQNDHHGAKHTVTSESDTLKYQSHNYYDNEYGKKLEFLLKNDKVAVTVHYQIYNGISVVRSWSEVENISPEPIGVEYISSFTYTFTQNGEPEVYIPHNSWCSELGIKKYKLSELGFDRVYGFATKRVSESNTGTWSSKEVLPLGALCDNTGTMLWQIENNGSWNWEIGDIADMLYLKLSGPSEQENGWYKELKKGEKFQTVKAAVSLADTFDNALCEITKYRRIIFNNNKPNSKLPVIFNDYMNCLTGDPTTEKLIPIIDKAALLGAEYFCVDAGWYADGTWWETVGEWMPCDWRFPGGIKEVFDRIKEKGMVPGIWLEIEVMGINCPILDKFSDDCFFMRHGKRIIDHGRYQLDFRNKKVRDYATKVIDRVVADYGVGYIKMDYNIDAGLGTEIDADSFGDGLLEHNRAYLDWIRSIKQKYPDLILENCASGGMRMDYAMLGEMHLQSTSDQTNYGPMAVIAANSSIAVLPEQAAMWSYPLSTGDDNEAAYNMINSMLIRVHLSGDVANLTEKQFSDVKEGIKVYKEIRNHIPDFLPFYPLGLNTYQKPFAAIGYKAKDKRYLAVWKMDTDEQSIEIPLENPKNAKLLYPLDTDARLQINDNGITLNMPSKFSAVLIGL